MKASLILTIFPYFTCQLLIIMTFHATVLHTSSKPLLPLIQRAASHPAAVEVASSCPRKYRLTCGITQLGVCHATAPTG